MKTYVFFLMVTAISASTSIGKIKNGYDREIQTAREGFNHLTKLLASDKKMSVREKNSIKRNLNKHRDFILYYEVTERLLSQFRVIAADIYNEIDTIKDARNRSVDVYVKFVPMEDMSGSVAGSTNISTAEDEHAYNSRYGLHTVSVRIVAVKNALHLLAHEFGHILHQVPNTAAYRKIYKNLYEDKATNFEEMGHHHTDPSGLNAFRFERAFRIKYVEFLKIRNNREETPVALIEEISNNWLL